MNADEVIAGLGIEVRPPGIRRRDAVLVTGPWLAGCTSVAEALRDRLPDAVDVDVVEADDLGPGDAPRAVVFVVSAAAQLAESDCALLDAAAAHTDPVVVVVSKIDLHRSWRETLAAGRAVLSSHRPRYAGVPWVGTAAAPDLGDPDVDDLVDAVVKMLSDESIDERNRLRAWESRLESTVADREHGAAGVGRQSRAASLREQRAELLRHGRSARAERAAALRGCTQQARVQLSHFARNRCTSLRTELSEDAAELTRRTLTDYPERVRRRIGEVTVEVDDGAAEQLADVAAELDLPAETAPPPTEPPVLTRPQAAARGPESRLMLLLGAGFGLGVALTVSRLFAGLAPALTAVASVLGVLIGLGLTVWVVATRRLLAERAALDRWSGDAVAALRAVLDEAVASRVLTAERDWTTALIEEGEARDERIVGRVRAVDTELREHAVARARAAAARDREVPELQRALAAVRAELGDPEPA